MNYPHLCLQYIPNVLWVHLMWRADLAKCYHAVEFSSTLEPQWIMIIISMTQSPCACVQTCASVHRNDLSRSSSVRVSPWYREQQAHPFLHTSIFLLSPTILYHPLSLTSTICPPASSLQGRSDGRRHLIACTSTLGVEGTKRGQRVVGIFRQFYSFSMW